MSDDIARSGRLWPSPRARSGDERQRVHVVRFERPAVDLVEQRVKCLLHRFAYNRIMSPRSITVRLDPEDHRLLAEEAERLGVRAGTLSRMLIRGSLRGGGLVLSPPRSRPELAPGERPDELREDMSARRDEVLRVAAARGARNLRVFGSRARGEHRAESDVDLLVELEPGRSLLDLVGLSQDLERLLGRRVDIVTDAGLSPHLRERIQAEAVAL